MYVTIPFEYFPCSEGIKTHIVRSTRTMLFLFEHFPCSEGIKTDCQQKGNNQEGFEHFPCSEANNWGQSKIKCLTQRLTGARPFGTLFIFKLA